MARRRPPDGIDVREPVYGAPPAGFRPADQEEAALPGLTVVSPAEVLATHLLEVIKRQPVAAAVAARPAPAARRDSNLTDRAGPRPTAACLTS
jgi:hypothetical protein